MAAPAAVTTRDISGKYVLNTKLSDPNVVEDILRVQNVSWVLRKAISLATVTLTVKHNPDNRGVERIEVVNTLTGGIPGTTELSVLDWTNSLHEDYVFGKVLGRSKRVDFPDGIEDPLLKEGWNASRGEKEDGVLYFYDENVGGSVHWTAEQLWGFGELNGERRHLRCVRMAGKDERARYFRLVYDYLGPL